MSQRFRIYHIRNNTLINKILFDVPSTAGTNPPTFVGMNPNEGYTAFEDMANEVINNSNGTILDFPNNFLWLTNVGLRADTDLPSYGMTNKIEFNNIDVNDRFYVNRWDNHHSYIEVTEKHITGSTQLKLKYCTPDGTSAYNNVTWSFSHAQYQDNCNTLPWIWNLKRPGNYRILTATFTMYYYPSTPLLSVQNYGYKDPVSSALAEEFWSNAEILETNPYEDAGETDTGGGDPNRQNWDNQSDAITPDAMPIKGALASGMVDVFSPTDAQVSSLADLLFSFNFFDWLQKNLQNLEELFVSFGVVPFTVTQGTTESVTFLGFDISSFAHPVYLTKAAQQYYEFDMGTISLTGSDSRIHASDSVFDYSPFSRLGIYLPFIGYQELDIDECRGSTLKLVYRVDIVSGTCVALIYANGAKDRCIYQFSGNCLTQIPLGSVDMSGIISGSINIAVAAASAGASSSIASAGDALTAENLANGDISAAGAKLQNAQHKAQVSHGQGSLTSATVNGIMGMKPNFKHSGAIGASGGLFAVKQPYLFLVTPREAVPKDYHRFCGLPSNICDTLGNFTGYTVVEDIRLNGLVATSSEVEEIYQLLKSGVII